MRHVAISMDDESLSRVELAAADAGVSLSEYITAKLAPKLQHSPQEEAEIRNRLKLLQEVFDGPKFDLSVNGRMPNADERNAR